MAVFSGLICSVKRDTTLNRCGGRGSHELAGAGIPYFDSRPDNGPFRNDFTPGIHHYRRRRRHHPGAAGHPVPRKLFIRIFAVGSSAWSRRKIIV